MASVDAGDPEFSVPVAADAGDPKFHLQKAIADAEDPEFHTRKAIADAEAPEFPLRMASANAGDPEFPTITPVQTKPPATEGELQSAATTSPSPPPPADEDQGCTTPRSEQHMLRPPTTCPPTPRKPRPASNRKIAPAESLFVDVPADLRSVFVAVDRCCRYPSRKKIRVWC